MALYIKEVLIPNKVVEVVNRFSLIDPVEEIPEELEDAALLWLNKACLKFKERVSEELDLCVRTDSDEEGVPTLPPLEYLWDMSDGWSLAALLSFYCPEDLRWREICFNEPVSLADSIYNLQQVQFFCQEKLLCDISFLSVEDFLDCHRLIRPNLMVFVADLLYHFEFHPAPYVRRPLVDNDAYYSETEERIGLIGSRWREFDLPTLVEMKAMSLQHTGSPGSKAAVADSSSGPKSISSGHNRKTPARGSRKRSSRGDENGEDDQEMTRYFPALDLEHDLDSSPELMKGKDGPLSMHPNNNSVTYSLFF